MPRGFLSIENSGLTEIADYLDKLGAEYDNAIKSGVNTMQDVITSRIKENWLSFGGKSNSYIYDSIGKSSEMSKTDEHTVVGTMGVYHMDNVAAKHGRLPRVTASGKVIVPLNAPQIAYWIEYGTTRLKGWGRKKKTASYSDEQLIDIAAKPFIGNAYYGSIEEQNEAFKAAFNKILDKIK